MNDTPVNILIRPTYESLCREFDYDPSEFGDPDKIDPILWEQGQRTEPIAVDPGESFEIPRDHEGCIGETQDEGRHVRIIDPTRSLDDDLSDEWGLQPGRYLYDGIVVTIVELFAAEQTDAEDE